jgi:hypothetical protein
LVVYPNTAFGRWRPLSWTLSDPTPSPRIAAGDSPRRRDCPLAIRRERLPTDMTADPTRVLKCSALAPALGAARRSQKQVAQCVRSPPDDEGRKGHWVAAHAVLAHHPAPRRAAASPCNVDFFDLNGGRKNIHE